MPRVTPIVPGNKGEPGLCSRYLDGLLRFGMRPGLERIDAILRGCGSPHRSFPVVHVAGTNGKGSVCAIVESILRAAGHRTGLYTSPHLHSYRERIQINGRALGEELLDRYAATLMPLADRIAPGPLGPPTYFEFMTALALLVFAAEGVTYAVMETGLGGRLDATNIVEARLAAITSISLEHQAQLGDSIAAIAGEKAAIIKDGAWVVCGELPCEARDVVAMRCREKRATLRETGDAILYEPQRISDGGSVLNIRGECGEYGSLSLPLPGRHQMINCAVAVGLIDGVRRQGGVVPDEALRRGIAASSWPGRLQVLSRAPLIIVDCAHNPGAAEALACALRDLYGGRRWILVCGMLGDKDIRGICAALAPRVAQGIAVPVLSDRSAAPEDVSAACLKAGITAGTTRSLPEAIAQARNAVARGAADGIVITGSTYLVGEAMRMAYLPGSEISPCTIPERQA